MHTEKEISSIKNQLISVIGGTLSGVVIRYVAWPLERIFYKKMERTNTATYPQLLRYNFTYTALRESHAVFMKAGALQTVGKSVSNFGVISYVETAYPEATSIEKGIRVALYSAPLETAFTTSGEMNKYALFRSNNLQNTTPFNVFNINNILSNEFGRALSATFLRSLYSGLITYGSIYGAVYFLETGLPEESKQYPTITKVTGAVVGSAVAQPFALPVIHLQNYVFEHNNKPIRSICQNIVKEYSLKDLTRGAVGRAANRSLSFGLGFFYNEAVRKFNHSSNAFDHDEETTKSYKK